MYMEYYMILSNTPILQYYIFCPFSRPNMYSYIFCLPFISWFKEGLSYLTETCKNETLKNNLKGKKTKMKPGMKINPLNPVFATDKFGSKFWTGETKRELWLSITVSINVCFFCLIVSSLWEVIYAFVCVIFVFTSI